MRSNERTIQFLTLKLGCIRTYATSLYGLRDSVTNLKPGTTAAVKEKERAGIRRTVPKGKSALLNRAGSTDLAGPARSASALEHMLTMEETQAVMLHTFCDEVR